MPEFRQYPQAVSLRSTDAFLIDRVNAGTMYIEAQDMEFGAGFSGYDIYAWSNNLADPITFNAVRAFTLPINFSGSKFSVEVFPVNEVIWNVYQNESLVGTISIGTTAITANIPDACTFNIGDKLKLVNPDGTNWGGANFSMTLKGERI